MSTKELAPPRPTVWRYEVLGNALSQFIGCLIICVKGLFKNPSTKLLLETTELSSTCCYSLKVRWLKNSYYTFP